VAVYAAPFSFHHRHQEMQRAHAARSNPSQATPADLALLQQHAARLAHFERQQWPLGTVNLPVFNPPGVGMERSHAEILKVFSLLGLPAEGKVFRGSTGYMPNDTTPCHSEAVDHLIQTARAGGAQDRLYVVAIGCVTNISSALLIAPDIAEKIVVVWTAGYPSHAPHTNFAFNLEQDLEASKLLFDSGVPLVYLPGYHVGAQLRLSLAEVERYVQREGAIGRYLHHLFTHNPLWDYLGQDGSKPHSWVIWDLINFAWLINPDWVTTHLVPTPVLGDDKRWQPGAGRPPMREAYALARDAIFNDFFAKLAQAPR
jgi:purine nucleosidase